MITLIVAIEILLLLMLGFFPLYLALLSLLALGQRKAQAPASASGNRFAIIVPAHDEENTIGETVRNILTVQYPRSLFDVIVVADNCTDNTALAARSAGATVWERSDTTRIGKGYALRWCFDRLVFSKPEYDACLVIDADSKISPNALYVLADHRRSGSSVIQLADVVAPQPGVWNAEIIRLGFTLYNVVRPMGRKVLGCSAGLRGNGMCIDTSVLKRVPWNAFSLAEDLEYGLNLLLNGIVVDFAQEARVIATMPSESVHSESQRSRWEIGRVPVVKQYTPLLLRMALRKFWFPAFDALIDLIMPPFVNMMAVITTMFTVHIVLELSGAFSQATYLWLWGIVWIAGLIHAFVGLFAASADSGLYSAIAYVPGYAVWKLNLYFQLLLKGRPNLWIRTTREFHDEIS